MEIDIHAEVLNRLSQERVQKQIIGLVTTASVLGADNGELIIDVHDQFPPIDVSDKSSALRYSL